MQRIGRAELVQHTLEDGRVIWAWMTPLLDEQGNRTGYVKAKRPRIRYVDSCNLCSRPKPDCYCHG